MHYAFPFSFRNNENIERSLAFSANLHDVKYSRIRSMRSTEKYQFTHPMVSRSDVFFKWNCCTYLKVRKTVPMYYDKTYFLTYQMFTTRVIKLWELRQKINVLVIIKKSESMNS